MDPRQVRPGDDGVLRCVECGTRYDLEPATAPRVVRERAAGFVAAVTSTAASSRGTRPDPATWSVNAYAAHMADVVPLLAGRLERIVSEDSPPLSNYDEDGEAERRRFDEIPAERSAVEVAEQAANAVLMLQRIADDPDADRVWRRTGVHSKLGEIPLWQVACDLAHELRHHADDVVAVARRVDERR